jgi:large subunit ribosomal protein L5
MRRIKQGDEVIVIAGKDKGRRGSVLRVYEDGRVLVENVNVAKKHQRGNPNTQTPGGIIEKEMPVDVSNVMVFNPGTSKGDRIGIKTLEDGRKVRFFKMSRLQDFYEKEVVPNLMERLSLKNVMAVPRITKITLNMGVGEAVADKKVLDNAMKDLERISGQKPVPTKARVSVANFKIRDGMLIGCKVTLRRERMYEFLDRLISVAIPRVRDFRGVPSRSFDGRGNFSMGVKEQIIFPEIDYDQVDAIRGLDIAITTTARDDEAGRALLEAFNFPLRGRS